MLKIARFTPTRYYRQWANSEIDRFTIKSEGKIQKSTKIAEIISKRRHDGIFSIAPLEIAPSHYPESEFTSKSQNFELDRFTITAELWYKIMLI